METCNCSPPHFESFILDLIKIDVYCPNITVSTKAGEKRQRSGTVYRCTNKKLTFHHAEISYMQLGYHDGLWRLDALTKY